jgi:hypothetical protein
MKIVSAHQPAYNPWLGYLHKILISDSFVIMDNVQFEKNSFINRNKIFHNSEVMLTIPVKTKNYKLKIIKDIEVSNHIWQKKHLKSIQLAYAKSINFDKIFPEIEKILSIKSKFLIDYTNAFLHFLISYLELKTEIIFGSELKIEAKKLDYVVETTKKLNGNIFVFGSLGKNYANIEYLKNSGITAYFQEYNHPIYKQNSSKFQKYMGIIDLLFNEVSVTEIILKDNIKKEYLK